MTSLLELALTLPDALHPQPAGTTAPKAQRTQGAPPLLPADAMPLPITLVPTERQGVIPERYVLIISATLCRCGVMHETSRLYAHNSLQSRWNKGTNVQHLAFSDEPRWNLPIQVRRQETKRVMVCHECVSPESLSHLPAPPPTVLHIHTPMPSASPIETRKSGTKIVRSLSDLASLLPDGAP